jgi:hypothetical protein
LKKSNIIFDGEKNVPLLRLAWNRKDDCTIAFIQSEQSYVTLVDVRMTTAPLMRLMNHKAPVNQVAWAPQTQ